MANEVRGNCYYIDSAGFALDFTKGMRIQSIALFATNTTSVIELSLYTNTAKIVYEQTSPDNNPVTISTYFGGVWMADRLFVRTLTAGTGVIYFS